MWILILLLIVSFCLPCKLQSTLECVETPECRCFVNSKGVQTAICEVYQIYSTVQNLPNTINNLHISCVSANQQTINKHILSKLPNLAYLSIEKCTLRHLSHDTLDISSLKTLIIHKCDVDNVTLFFNSSSLQTLNISDSGLTSFPEISEHVNISSINISSNNLNEYRTFETICGTQSVNLLELDLSHNNFNRLPLTRDCLQSLKVLIFANNPPLVIDKDYFQHLTEISILDLSETILNGDIPFLDHLQSLTTLKLQGSGQKIKLALKEFGQLKELHLKNILTSDVEILNDVSSLVNLQSLQLIACGIGRVPKNAFQKLTELKVLDLSRNDIKFLTRGTYDTLKKLKRLILSHNKLGIIFAELFTSANLDFLDISCNNIVLIGEHSFSTLSQLTFLNISFNRLSSLPNNIFDNMVILEQLFLNHNQLKFLPSLRNLEHLLYLGLSDNKLMTIDEKTFRGLKKLVGLSLRNNSITNLPSTVFRDSTELIILNLAQNFIEHIQMQPGYLTPWGNLTKVIVIRLDNNRIRYLKDELSYFKRLESLFLDYNQIYKIDADMFPESLYLLDLSYNRISKVGNLFRKLTRLRRISLKSNDPYLTKLDLSGFIISLSKFKPTVSIGFNGFKCDCNIQWLKALTLANYDLPQPLRNVPIFDDLHQTYCRTDYGLVKLIEYPIKNFTCVYDKKDFECLFDCSCCVNAADGQCPCAYYCPDNCYCEKGSLLFRKNEVDCRSRNKSNVPPTLPPDSTSIDLSGNFIPVILKNSFHGLAELEHLFLNNSAIKTLEQGCFDTLPNLVSLYLDHNRLEIISSGVFNKLASLKILYLHKNNIHQVSPWSFKGVNSLEMLTLHANSLGSVESLHGLDNVTGSITLGQNEWSCECDFMDSFLDVIISNAFKITDVNELTCSWPERSLLPNFNLTEPSSILYRNSNETLVLEFDFKDWCSNKTVLVNNTLVRQLLVYDNRFVSTIIGVTLLFVSLIVLGTLLIWKRHLLQVLIYDKFGIRVMPGKVTAEKDFKFDAFICYGDKEEHFVIHELLERLEKEKHFKICLESRDFPIGDSKADSIVDAVDNSRKTILIISKSFLDDEWCKFVFQTAHHVMVSGRSDNIIVVLKEQINNELLEPDLRGLLKTRTYVEYGDPWFWEKLYFVMPDRKNDDDKVTHQKEIELEFVENKV